MHGDITALPVAVDEGVLVPAALVRAHAAPAHHLAVVRVPRRRARPRGLPPLLLLLPREPRGRPRVGGAARGGCGVRGRGRPKLGRVRRRRRRQLLAAVLACCCRGRRLVRRAHHGLKTCAGYLAGMS